MTMKRLIERLSMINYRKILIRSSILEKRFFATYIPKNKSSMNVRQKVWGWLAVGVFMMATVVVSAFGMAHQLERRYQTLESSRIVDRNGIIVGLVPNSRGYYSVFSETPPDHIRTLLIRKEDRFFSMH